MFSVQIESQNQKVEFLPLSRIPSPAGFATTLILPQFPAKA